MNPHQTPLSFELVNQAIEQQALARKISGLDQERRTADEWVVNDAISKGIPIGEISVGSSRNFARPTAAQLRSADALHIDPETGAIAFNLSAFLRQEMNTHYASGTAHIEIPEVVPIFTGLRKVINNWRLGRLDEKADDLLRHKAVSAHVGTIVKRNRFSEGFYTHADDYILQAPTSRRDRRTAEKIKELARKRHRTISNISRSDILLNDRINTAGQSGVKHNVRLALRAAQDARAERLSHKLDTIAYRSPKVTRKLSKIASRKARVQAKLAALESQN